MHILHLKDIKGLKLLRDVNRAADIIPVNGGKGLGVEKVLEYYHLSKASAIAFGVGTNDIEMLQVMM